jgi:hypothetical protein
MNDMGLVITFLVMLGVGGGGSQDLVSLVDAKPYFKSRGIAMRAEKLAALAGKAPTDGKEAVVQLLAIRWLGEHPDVAKKAAGARQTLEAVAAGKQGKDPEGFARDYARHALARLDGTPLTLHTLPAGSVRGDALRCFPKSSAIFGALDFRSPRGIAEQPGNPLADLMNRMIIPRDKELFYKVVERLGNIRLDSASFAVIPDTNNPGKTGMYVLLTGKGDRKRLLDYFRQELQNLTLKERKGPSGDPITLFEAPHGGPAVAIIGDRELVIAGYPGPRSLGGQPPNQLELVDELLAVRAQKKPCLLTGPYAGTLKGVSPRASALVLGDLPDAWRQEMLRGRGNPFKGLPKSFTIVALRNVKGLQIRFTGGAANAGEAKGFVDGVAAVKQMALDGLKKLAAGGVTSLPAGFIKLKPKTVEALRGEVESIQLESRDALLTGEAFISNEAAKAAFDLVAMSFFRVARAVEQPKPEKIKR